SAAFDSGTSSGDQTVAPVAASPSINLTVMDSSRELPACPVCLDRLDDSVTGGALTIPCNHTFHEACLRRWGDSSCPVCRYCLLPEEERSSCVVCGTQSESLWICLICAHIGCGRYADGHA